MSEGHMRLLKIPDIPDTSWEWQMKFVSKVAGRLRKAGYQAWKSGANIETNAPIAVVEASLAPKKPGLRARAQDRWDYGWCTFCNQEVELRIEKGPGTFRGRGGAKTQQRHFFCTICGGGAFPHGRAAQVDPDTLGATRIRRLKG